MSAHATVIGHHHDIFKFGRNRSKARDPLDSGGANCFFARQVSVAFSKEDARRGREVTIDEAGKVNGYDVKWIKGRRGSGGWTVARAPPAGTDHVAAVKAEPQQLHCVGDAEMFRGALQLTPMRKGPGLRGAA